MGRRTEQPVSAGTYWQDAFPPGSGRVVKVMDLDETHATIMTLVNTSEVQRTLDLPARITNCHFPKDMRGCVRRVRLDRFRPTTKGFIPVADGPAEIARRDADHARRVELALRPRPERPEGPGEIRPDDGSFSLDATGTRFEHVPADETFVL